MLASDRADTPSRQRLVVSADGAARPAFARLLSTCRLGPSSRQLRALNAATRYRGRKTEAQRSHKEHKVGGA